MKTKFTEKDIIVSGIVTIGYQGQTVTIDLFEEPEAAEVILQPFFHRPRKPESEESLFKNLFAKAFDAIAKGNKLDDFEFPEFCLELKEKYPFLEFGRDKGTGLAGSIKIIVPAASVQKPVMESLFKDLLKIDGWQPKSRKPDVKLDDYACVLHASYTMKKN